MEYLTVVLSNRDNHGLIRSTTPELTLTVVTVQGAQAQNIPNYPVDASGKSQLPIYA